MNYFCYQCIIYNTNYYYICTLYYTYFAEDFVSRGGKFLFIVTCKANKTEVRK